MLALGGILILLAGVLWPRKGLVSAWRQWKSKNLRVACEDALKQIYNEQVDGHRSTLASIAGALQTSVSRAAETLGEMEKKHLVTFQNGALRLTSEGRRYALHVIRAHRLWERYLAEETGFAEGEWHLRAERIEHDLTPQQTNDLYARLNYPSHDPHGDPIPTADGELQAETGQPLTSLPVDGVGRILHLEDEPPSIYAQLVAQGLRPGMEVRILDKGADHMRFWAGGDEHLLATLLANSVTVVACAESQEGRDFATFSLAQLAIGSQGRVLGLSPASRGADRRRLLDLGFVPGAVVEAEMASPNGDPTAYRIRGSLIALRREQASLIRIQAVENTLAA